MSARGRGSGATATRSSGAPPERRSRRGAAATATAASTRRCARAASASRRSGSGARCARRGSRPPARGGAGTAPTPASPTGARPTPPRERAEARRAAGEAYAPDHDFSARAPGSLAVTDVSELPACGTRLHLSPVVGCFDGLPAARGLSRRPDSSLCDGSLAAYLDGLPAGSSPTVHTDGGGPYRAASRKGLCSRRGVARSMSMRGRCGDNARAEGFFGTLKVELLCRRDWSRASPGEFRAAPADYMGWYREGRLKLFVEPDGTRRYETIMGRRRRLGLTA